MAPNCSRILIYCGAQQQVRVGGQFLREGNRLRDGNPAPELGADQDCRELIEQLLGDNGDHLPGDEQLYDSGAPAVRVDQGGDQHVGVDDDPEGFRQRSAGPAGGTLGAHGRDLLGRDTPSFFVTGGVVRADVDSDAPHGTSAPQVMLERSFKHLVVVLSGPRCGHLRCPKQLLVDVDRGLLPSHVPILAEKLNALEITPGTEVA